MFFFILYIRFDRLTSSIFQYDAEESIITNSVQNGHDQDTLLQSLKTDDISYAQWLRKLLKLL